MKAEIISVGTEIILGQIVNTNARFLADQLRQLDIHCNWQTTVDDESGRINAAIQQAKSRADLIFICGGLGPTKDDVTMQSVADALGTTLELDDEYWQQVQADFQLRGIKCSPENIRQAYYLKGGDKLVNPVGLALGAMIEQDQHTYVVLPGPPREFKAMVRESLLPRLNNLNSGRSIVGENLHFVGCPESTLMDEIQEQLKDQPEIIATSYVQPDEIQVRLTVYDQDPELAQEWIQNAKVKILKRVGQYYFGSGEEITLAKQVVDELAAQGLTISAAESLTGGLFQSTICSVPGASKVFAGGFVTYATVMKTKLLGIPSRLIEQHSVVSGEVAGAMAEQCQRLTGADCGIGFTGVAGPDELEGHPVGEVWMGINFFGRTYHQRLQLAGRLGRQAIRQQSVQLGLLALHHLLTQNK